VAARGAAHRRSLSHHSTSEGTQMCVIRWPPKPIRPVSPRIYPGHGSRVLDREFPGPPEFLPTLLNF
jgi:hypothetical protein